MFYGLRVFFYGLRECVVYGLRLLANELATICTRDWDEVRAEQKHLHNAGFRMCVHLTSVVNVNSYRKLRVLECFSYAGTKNMAYR